MKLNEIGEYAS